MNLERLNRFGYFMYIPNDQCGLSSLAKCSFPNFTAIAGSAILYTIRCQKTWKRSIYEQNTA